MKKYPNDNSTDISTDISIRPEQTDLKRPTVGTPGDAVDDNIDENIDDAVDEDAEVDERSEMLVAYLEDEMPPEQRAELERKLEDDPSLRAELAQLSESWDMLDVLETRRHDPALTRSTMEMVAVNAEEELRAMTRHSRQCRVTARVTALVLVLAAALFGAVVVSLFMPASSEMLERNRHMYARIDQLEAVGDFAFLLQLRQSGLFNEPVALAPANVPPGPPPDRRETVSPTPKPVPTSKPTSSAPVSEPVPGMAPGMVAGQTETPERALARQTMRFHRLDRAKRKALTELYRLIETATDAEVLFTVLDHYYSWYSLGLHETERNLIKTTPTATRLARVRSIMAQRRQTPQKDQRGHFGDQRNRQGGFAPMNRIGPNQNQFDRSRRIVSLLPMELRNEDWTAIRQKFAAFCRERKERSERDELSVNRDGKDNAGGNAPGTSFDRGEAVHWRNDPGFRQIYEFLTVCPVDELVKLLSPKAQEFMKTKTVRERQRFIGFVLSFDLYGNTSNEHGQLDGAPFGSPYRRGDNRREMGERPPATQNESTKELAGTLRRLPQSMRDELLSLPSDEMYARLLAIHWGFESEKARRPETGRDFNRPASRDVGHDRKESPRGAGIPVRDTDHTPSSKEHEP